MGIDGFADRPWLLLPGTLCTGAVFDRFLDALGVRQDQRTVVLLDQPSVVDYAETFDGLSSDTIVCGFSLGAIVAAHAADRMDVHRLILFGLNPFADDPAKAASRHDLARDVVTLGGAPAMASRLSDVFGQTPDATRTEICKMADDTAPLIVAQTQLALSRPGALPALEQAKMPVLSLTGSLDRGAPPDQGLAAARAAPHGRFHTLEGLGHFALLEDPIACAIALGRLMESTNDTA